MMFSAIVSPTCRVPHPPKKGQSGARERDTWYNKDTMLTASNHHRLSTEKHNCVESWLVSPVVDESSPTLTRITQPELGLTEPEKYLKKRTTGVIRGTLHGLSALCACETF